MKLGAQFYSLRTECTTPEGLYNSMRKIKDIGYEIIQISGVIIHSPPHLVVRWIFILILYEGNITSVNPLYNRCL